jgi:diguanylate cyclase (GGDEF)-like protein
VIKLSGIRLGGLRRREEVPPAKVSLAPLESEGGAILTHLADFLDAFMWQAQPKTLEFTFVSKGVRDLLGSPESGWLGGPDAWGTFIHVDDRQRVVDEMRSTAADGCDREIEFRANAADGRPLVLRHAIRLLESPSGEPELWGITTDVTADKQTSEMLRDAKERYRAASAEASEFRRRAITDALTGLPNRILFEDRLATAIRAAGRVHEPCAVLLMDLDRFKELNDTLGHEAGDIMLKNVALRFRICLREQDTTARLGGDEFAAVLPKTDADGAARLADRIVRILADPIEIDGQPRHIGASIGIATFPDAGTDARSLLARADAAMYRAKSEEGHVAIAEADEAMPRKRKPRRARRVVIGLAAALAIAAAGLAPVAFRRAAAPEPPARLTAAVRALESASSDPAVAIVEGVQRALDELPLDDVSDDEVAHTLARLEWILHDFDPATRRSLGGRVEQLQATIDKAQQAAEPTPAVPGAKQSFDSAPAPHLSGVPTEPGLPSPNPAPIGVPKLP